METVWAVGKQLKSKKNKKRMTGRLAQSINCCCTICIWLHAWHDAEWRSRRGLGAESASKSKGAPAPAPAPMVSSIGMV